MGDSSSNQERYCSSYYDKHGLYNDGFPCPDDKYCCQTPDGSKACCDANSTNNAEDNGGEAEQNLSEETVFQKPNYIDKNAVYNRKNDANNIYSNRFDKKNDIESHILSTLSPNLNRLQANENSNQAALYTPSTSNPLLASPSPSSAASAALPFLLSK
jgi:hypothetical protein